MDDIAEDLTYLVRRPYTIKTVADVPFGSFPEYPVGPALITHAGWNTSLSHGAHINGFQVGAFKVISERPWVTEKHPLDGELYPTREAADRAKYDAGIIGFMVYDDTVWASVGSWGVAQSLGGSWVSGRVMGVTPGSRGDGKLMTMALDPEGTGSWTAAVLTGTVLRTERREPIWAPTTVSSTLYHLMSDKGYLATRCGKTIGFSSHRNVGRPELMLPEGTRYCAECKA